MLNLSQNSVLGKFSEEKYRALARFQGNRSRRKVLQVLVGALVLLAFSMALPWTQNIQTKGKLTTLRPDQRPQTIPTVIPGRIEAWFVKEGDFVQKGDTLLLLSEVKDDYFDPNLLERTQQQLAAKEGSVQAYGNKMEALDAQIEALERTSTLKRAQAENKWRQAKLKVVMDSTDWAAAQVNESIARDQFARMEEMYQSGLKSLTDLESRRLALQRAQASTISAESKLLAARNEVLNTEVELTSVVMSYRDDIAKAQSEKFGTESTLLEAEAGVTKLQNQYMNYSIRKGLHYIIAPQDGYISKTLPSGIGETVKEGEDLLSIVPSQFEMAVELFIDPVDLPLLRIGQPVRIQFDGWPSIVFSGWPNTSYGTFGGKVYGIDNFTNDQGKFRVLVAPDPELEPWPKALRPGAGTRAQILLKDVPLGYEIWRQLNGFPPDFYPSPVPAPKPAK